MLLFQKKRHPPKSEDALFLRTFFEKSNDRKQEEHRQIDNDDRRTCGDAKQKRQHKPKHERYDRGEHGADHDTAIAFAHTHGRKGWENDQRRNEERSHQAHTDNYRQRRQHRQKHIVK